MNNSKGTSVFVGQGTRSSCTNESSLLNLVKSGYVMVNSRKRQSSMYMPFMSIPEYCELITEQNRMCSEFLDINYTTSFLSILMIHTKQKIALSQQLTTKHQ